MRPIQNMTATMEEHTHTQTHTRTPGKASFRCLHFKAVNPDLPVPRQPSLVEAQMQSPCGCGVGWRGAALFVVTPFFRVCPTPGGWPVADFCSCTWQTFWGPVAPGYSIYSIPYTYIPLYSLNLAVAFHWGSRRACHPRLRPDVSGVQWSHDC